MCTSVACTACNAGMADGCHGLRTLHAVGRASGVLKGCPASSVLLHVHDVDRLQLQLGCAGMQCSKGSAGPSAAEVLLATLAGSQRLTGKLTRTLSC
jgi:hypothetical protein